MKNILLILLLANILYFLWGWFAQEEAEQGVVLVNESDLGPQLSVAETPQADPMDGIGAVLDGDSDSSFAGSVGRSCVTIGPFREKGDADAAQTRYAAEQMRTDLRSGRGQYFVGHWVQIRDVPSKDESNRMLAVLKQGGLADAYPVETDDEGLKISLGLFGNLESAEKIELDAEALGLDADISPRMSEGEVHWVDIRLPPGKGAGEIIERYGDEQIKLRDQATCPPD